MIVAKCIGLKFNYREPTHRLDVPNQHIRRLYTHKRTRFCISICYMKRIGRITPSSTNSSNEQPFLLIKILDMLVMHSELSSKLAIGCCKERTSEYSSGSIAWSCWHMSPANEAKYSYGLEACYSELFSRTE